MCLIFGIGILHVLGLVGHGSLEAFQPA